MLGALMDVEHRALDGLMPQMWPLIFDAAEGRFPNAIGSLPAQLYRRIFRILPEDAKPISYRFAV
jgi:hypothetical protein